jgi:hypothetical protein
MIETEVLHHLATDKAFLTELKNTPFWRNHGNSLLCCQDGGRRKHTNCEDNLLAMIWNYNGKPNKIYNVLDKTSWDVCC